MFASRILRKASRQGIKSNSTDFRASLESRLGYKFADNKHLIEARTHPGNKRIAGVGKP